jgi:hypothetical protein
MALIKTADDTHMDTKRTDTGCTGNRNRGMFQSEHYSAIFVAPNRRLIYVGGNGRVVPIGACSGGPTFAKKRVGEHCENVGSPEHTSERNFGGNANYLKEKVNYAPQGNTPRARERKLRARERRLCAASEHKLRARERKVRARGTQSTRKGTPTMRSK